MDTVTVKYYEMWNTSITMLWGKSPKVRMICGNCDYSFSKRFEPIDFRTGYPKALCPCCHTLNTVPIMVS